MKKTFEKKEKTANEIARSFFWNSFGSMFAIFYILYFCELLFNFNFSSYFFEELILGIFLFFYEFTIVPLSPIAILFFLCFMLFARHKIKKTTIVKKSQIKSISLNLLLRFSILAFLFGYGHYAFHPLSEPPYGLLLYEVFIFTTCATVFLISISEKD